MRNLTNFNNAAMTVEVQKNTEGALLFSILYYMV